VDSFTEAEVDVFVSAGNVLVDKALSPTEEVAALRRLRDFLVTFAVDIGFDARRWCNVVFILKNVPRNSFQHSLVARCILVEVPQSFRNRDLLDFLGRHVPQARTLK
jgi:hypothetical protein